MEAGGKRLRVPGRCEQRKQRIRLQPDAFSGSVIFGLPLSQTVCK